MVRPIRFQHDYGLSVQKSAPESKIQNVYGVIIILFAAEQRAFIIDINQIDKLKSIGKKSINIKKIDNWEIKYIEIQTIPSRKVLLDYTGEFQID